MPALRFRYAQGALGRLWYRDIAKIMTNLTRKCFKIPPSQVEGFLVLDD